MYDLPTYVWLLVLLGVIGIPAATCVVLYRGALSAASSRVGAVRIAGGAAILFGGWLVASALFARAGHYHRFTPWLGVAVIGFLIILLALTRVPSVSRALASPAGSLSRLALPHTVRVVGVVFLLVMTQGHLPPVFALPAGIGDIAIGLAAPLIARRLARGNRRGAVHFHILGILDLVVALSVGFLAGLGPFRLLPVTQSTEPLSLLPLALVPTVAVPLAIALHIVSLRRLHAVQPEQHNEGSDAAPERAIRSPVT